MAGSRIWLRWGHSALTWPNRDSIQAWSVGVPGRPKCWWMAHKAMNSLVEPEVIWGPLSLSASSTGRAGSSMVGSTRPSWRAATRSSSPFGFQRVTEHDLDLGGGLLDRDDLGQPLAADQVLDHGRGDPGGAEVGRVVDPDRPRPILHPV